jgi:methyl-accepting chemotaxis protein
MTIKQTTKLSESLTRKRLMQLELLTASVVPAAAILVIAVAGSAIQFNAIFFILDVLTCAIAVFFGERSIILKMHGEMDEQLSDLTTACRAFIQGNKEARVLMPGDDQLALLASSINGVFDYLQTIASASKDNTSANHTKTNLPDTTSEDFDLINQQLEELVEEISPALDGDLRVQSYIDEDTFHESVAMVADLCNALVEKLVQFTRWTLYASTKMIKRSRNVLVRLNDLAQTTETQMLALGTMIATVEKLVAFIQRMGSALQLNVDMAQEIYTYLQASKAVTNSDQFSTILEQLTTNTQRQLHLLEEILASTHNTTTIADSTIGDLYAFAQQFYQSSTTIIKTAESVNSIVTIAQDWFTEAEKLSLPEDEE